MWAAAALTAGTLATLTLAVVARNGLDLLTVLSLAVLGLLLVGVFGALGEHR